MTFYQTHSLHSLLLISTCYLYPQFIQKQPLMHQRRTLSKKLPKIFRRSGRIEKNDLKNEITLETERNTNVRFLKELATLKNKCEKLITMEIVKFILKTSKNKKRRKDNISSIQLGDINTFCPPGVIVDLWLLAHFGSKKPDKKNC